MIPLIPLNSTNLLISQVGLGTVKFGRNQGVHYPEKFDLPSDHDIQELLALARELGINLLDTAPAYGSSEERLGQLLKSQRHHWIISTKVGEEFVEGKSFFDFSEDAVRKSIERSLKRLNTDYLDIVLVHSNGDDVKIIEEGIFDHLSQFKKAGLLRTFGMSTKTPEGGKLAVDHADVVMVTYNPLQQDDLPVISYAEKNQKNIFIKKALVSGHLHKIGSEDPVQDAMSFIFREKGVSSIIVGTLNATHLTYNVQCAEKALQK